MSGEAHGQHGACIFLDTFPKTYISGPYKNGNTANKIADSLNANRNSPLEIKRNAEVFSEHFKETIIRPFEDEDMGKEMNAFIKEELATD